MSISAWRWAARAAWTARLAPGATRVDDPMAAHPQGGRAVAALMGRPGGGTGFARVS
jgi:hypothetical protein